MAGPLRNKTNEPFSTTPITDEIHIIGEDVANEVFLDDAPLPGGSITVVDPDGPTTYTRVVGTPSATEYRVEEETGRIIFNSANNGTDVEIDYTSIGPRVLARDINRGYDRLKGDQALNEGSPYVAEVTVTAAASVNLNLKTQAVAFMSLTTNVTLETETNVTAGRAGQLACQQDGTGGRTITFGANWFVEGTVPSGANERFVISWRVRGSEIWAVISGVLV